MNAVNSTWTPEKIKQLKKLLGKGKSSLEIGKELGISKNAVIGKIHRLGLNVPKPSEEKVVPVVSENKKVQKLTHVGLLDLKFNSCRWPIGEPKDKDFHFCGAVCQTGKPYCPEHCKIAYTSLKELSLQNAKKEPAVSEVKEIEKTADKTDPIEKTPKIVVPLKEKKEKTKGKKDTKASTVKQQKNVKTIVKKKDEQVKRGGGKTKADKIVVQTVKKTGKSADKKNTPKTVVDTKQKAPLKKKAKAVALTSKESVKKKETAKKESVKKGQLKKESVVEKAEVSKKVTLKKSVSDRLLSLMKKIKK